MLTLLCLLLEAKFQPPSPHPHWYPQNLLKNVNGSPFLSLPQMECVQSMLSSGFLMTRKKNKNKLSNATTTKKSHGDIHVFERNKKNKNKLLHLQYGFFKAVITPQSLCSAYLVLLLFNLQSTLSTRNTVGNEPKQAEEMHMGQ